VTAVRLILLAAAVVAVAGCGSAPDYTGTSHMAEALRCAPDTWEDESGARGVLTAQQATCLLNGADTGSREPASVTLLWDEDQDHVTRAIDVELAAVHGPPRSIVGGRGWAVVTTSLPAAAYAHRLLGGDRMSDTPGDSRLG
jgi:hypothetical protein